MSILVACIERPHSPAAVVVHIGDIRTQTYGLSLFDYILNADCAQESFSGK